jgi:hypothetical protein
MSVCGMLAAAEPALLGASFFFSRQSADRSNPKNVVRTLAYQLARFTTQLKLHILAAIEEHSDVTSLPMSEQVKRFIADPLAKAKDLPPVVVFVFDAFDECDREGSKFIKLFASILGDRIADVTVKLFVTSRLEEWIQDTFDSIKLQQKSYKLHNIEDSVVDADIHRFLSYHLNLIAKRPNLKLTDWPSKDDLALLVIRCARLFIYAAIVLRYINMEGASPVDRLRDVLQLNATGLQGHYAELDALYAQVLQGGIHSKLTLPEMDIIRQVAGTVVSLREPQPVSAIVSLADMSSHQVHAALGQLHAVLILPKGFPSDAEGVVRILHPSFPDFLIDPDRCPARFLVKSPIHHARLSHHCLEIMNTQLVTNICKLSDPFTPRSEIPNLDTVVNEHVSPELAYACCFWLVHLRLCISTNDPSVLSSLFSFCIGQGRVLAWIEVCSLLDVLSSSISNLHAIQSSIQVSNVQHHQFMLIAYFTFRPSQYSRLSHPYCMMPSGL